MGEGSLGREPQLCTKKESRPKVMLKKVGAWKKPSRDHVGGGKCKGSAGYSENKENT